MTVEMRLMLCFVIAVVSVIPALVAFFESKKYDNILKKVNVICGVVFVPTHIIYATFSLLARTNEGFTIMSLTWFSIVIFVLSELSLFGSVFFYFFKKKLGLNFERGICITFVAVNGVFGLVYPLYHYLISTIDFLTMIVFLLPIVAHTVVLTLNSMQYEKTKKTNAKLKK